MRKSVSLNNLSEYRHTDDIPNIIAEDEKNKTSSGYVSADDAVPISSSRERKRGYCRESTSCSCLGQVLSFALQVVLESACKDDEELRAVLGDSIGNPELMRKKVTNWCYEFANRLYMHGLTLKNLSLVSPTSPAIGKHHEMDPRRNGSETACGLHTKPSLSAKHDCTALIDVMPTRINVDDVLELIQTKANMFMP
ncbi:hypothetical protein F2Q69_00035426 [Brassica cretica]|uniref:Uncharacterized protein n=1 Tax=Brassica cretica TaxID=69181 RepID=A0A8S9SG81_BRACR|nr:hypothetical protein F2Q69_00035426 [Brassica cretica]